MILRSLPLFAALALPLKAQTPSATLSFPQPSAQGTEALRLVVKEFLDCWYVRREEPCFWSHVAESATRLKGYKEAYSGAFHDDPKPQTLKISAGDADDWLRREGLSCLNDSVGDGFCILSGGDFLRVEAPGEPGDAQFTEYISESIREGLLPQRDDFMVVTYLVQGEGYNEEGLNLFWIPEDGRWRLFSLSGFD